MGGCDVSLRRRRTVRYFYDFARSFFSKNDDRKRRFVALKTPISRGERRFANFENGVFLKGKTAKRRFQKKIFCDFGQKGKTAKRHLAICLVATPVLFFKYIQRDREGYHCHISPHSVIYGHEWAHASFNFFSFLFFLLFPDQIVFCFPPSYVLLQHVL